MSTSDDAGRDDPGSNADDDRDVAPVEAAEQKRTTVFAALAVGSVVALLIVLLAVSPSGDSKIYSSVLEEVAPLTVGETLNGTTFDLRDARGQWVLVNFFATWCTGCIIEHPELVEWNARHVERGDATVVSVVYEDGSGAVQEFFDQRGGDWPVIADDDGSIPLSYGVTAVPESYLIAPSGRVVAKYIGASGVTADNIDATIAELSAPVEG